jgi:SPP1 family predicted phage head-tail adaptor
MKAPRAGQLDRRVVLLERRADRIDPTYGTKEPNWEPLATVWAQVEEAAPSNAAKLIQEVSEMRRPVTVRIRWRSDITAANRLRIDGVEMKIVGGPAMIGRREALEIAAEAISTEGDEP